MYRAMFIVKCEGHQVVLTGEMTAREAARNVAQPWLVARTIHFVGMRFTR